MSKYNSTLTAEQLRWLLHYDPETGVFTRLIQLCNRVQVGDIAGFIKYNGYRVIKVGDKPTPYFAHRLAWLYIHGEWPSKGIDHIDGDRANNRIANLREAIFLVAVEIGRAK